MKQFYLILFSLLVSLSALANKRTLKVKNGQMMDSTSWNPVGLPKNGDVLVIPQGHTLKVSGNLNLSNYNISLIVDGILYMENAKLDLGPQSSIYLTSGSAILVPEKNNPSNTISIGGSEKYSGRSESIYGPALADITTTSSKSNSINSSSFEKLSLNVVLPVKFLSFNVSRSSNGVSVQWATAEEINADVFIIERSEDGKTWRTVGSVKAVGNSTNNQHYAFTDKTILNNIAYYRIRQVDVDGKFTYTDIKTVVNKANQANASNNVTVYPANNNVVINFSKEVKGAVVVRLVSFSGQVLVQQTYTTPSQQIVLNRTPAGRGNYIVSVSNNLDLAVSKQIAL